MTGQPVQRELQHDLAGADRPRSLAFDILQAFQEATNVDQQA